MAMIQLGSNMMVAGSLYLMKFPFQVMMERRRGWEGSFRNWILAWQWMQGFKFWTDTKVHTRK